MKNKEKDPVNLGGLGGTLPAEVLKEYKGSIVFNIFESGSQYVDHVDNQYFGIRPVPPKEREKRAEPTVLPEVLATNEAMALWEKVQKAGYVDANYQPLISRTQSALLAFEIAKRLDIKDKWKTFEVLWNRRNMYRDYHDALEQHQSLLFRDTLKKLFQ